MRKLMVLVLDYDGRAAHSALLSKRHSWSLTTMAAQRTRHS